MKKILNLICLLALCYSASPVQAKQLSPTLAEAEEVKAKKVKAKEEKAASSATPVTPLSFSEYQKVVSKVDLKDHTISLEALEKEQGKSKVVLLDLRDPEEYKQGHIKGAISFGADISKERLEKFVPDKKTTVVIYCTNNFFPTRRVSLNFASLPQVLTAGYANTFILEDLWQSAGFASVDKFKASPLWQVDEKSKLPTSDTKPAN